MVAEATSQSREPGFALPAGIHRRQMWRPAALRGGQSILSGITSRIQPLEGQRARLTAWYEQFVQRSQPFLGWQPSTTAELGAPETQFSLGNPRSEERITRESPMISKELPPSTRSVSMTQDQASPAHPRRFPAEQQKPPEPFALRRSISGPIDVSANWTSPNRPLAGDLPAQHERSMEAAVQPVAPSTRKETVENLAVPAAASEEKRLSARDGRFALGDWGSGSPLRASAQRNQERPLERPALRLAILRPIHTAVATVQRKGSDPLSSSTSGPAISETKYFGVGDWPTEAQSPLISSMSFPQRQEVRGDFPAHPKGEVPPDADISSEGLVRSSGRELSAFRDAVMQSSSLASLREAEIPGPPAIPPATPPGIQIRLLRTDESKIQTSGNDVAKPGRPTTATPVPQPPPPAAPPLDINAVADKVFQTLQRRHQLERERRGLY